MLQSPRTLPYSFVPALIKAIPCDDADLVTIVRGFCINHGFPAKDEEDILVLAEEVRDRCTGSASVVWADDASPFTGVQVKALLDENEELRESLNKRPDHAEAIKTAFLSAVHRGDPCPFCLARTDNVWPFCVHFDVCVVPTLPGFDSDANTFQASPCAGDPHAADCQAMLGDNDDSACDCDGRATSEAKPFCEKCGASPSDDEVCVCDWRVPPMPAKRSGEAPTEATQEGRLHTQECLEYAAKTRKAYCIVQCSDARTERVRRSEAAKLADLETTAAEAERMRDESDERLRAALLAIEHVAIAGGGNGTLRDDILAIVEREIGRPGDPRRGDGWVMPRSAEASHARKPWVDHIHNFLADHLDVHMSDQDIADLAEDIAHWSALRGVTCKLTPGRPITFDDEDCRERANPIIEQMKAMTPEEQRTVDELADLDASPEAIAASVPNAGNECIPRLCGHWSGAPHDVTCVKRKRETPSSWLEREAEARRLLQIGRMYAGYAVGGDRAGLAYAEATQYQIDVEKWLGPAVSETPFTRPDPKGGA